MGLISFATGAMRCRILNFDQGVSNAIASCGLAALTADKGVVHVWVNFLFASTVLVVAIVYNWEA
jgi:hypothetical protein